MDRQPPRGALRHEARTLVSRVMVKELLILALLALLALFALRAHAAVPMTAAGVMERGEERLRGLRDYDCLVELESRLGERVQTGACRFWYKQPRMLRLKVIRGSRKGSQVALDSTGQMRGSKGGILGLIVRRMKTTDPRLRTIRGTSIMMLDWGALFQRYHAAALRPAARVAVAPHEDPYSPYQVQVSYPDRGMRVREVYSVDPQRWLIVEGAVYEDETRVEHVDFQEIKLDTGLTDGWFRL